MTARTRRLAILFAGLFAVALLFSTIWFSINLCHTCLGDNCPICAQLETIEGTMRRMCAGVALAALAVASCCAAVRSMAAQQCAEAGGTLVSLKVKLSN